MFIALYRCIHVFIVLLQVYGGTLGEETEEAFAGGIIRQDLLEEAEINSRQEELREAFKKLHREEQVTHDIQHHKAVARKHRRHEGGRPAQGAHGHNGNEFRIMLDTDLDEEEEEEEEEEEDVRQGDWKLVKRGGMPTDETTTDDDSEAEDEVNHKELESLKKFFPREREKVQREQKVLRGGEIPQDIHHDELAHMQLKARKGKPLHLLHRGGNKDTRDIVYDDDDSEE